MKLKQFDRIFILIVLIDLLGIMYQPYVRMVVKPLIVTSLLVYYVRSMEADQRKIILAALLFGLVGDIFLLFDNSEIFFNIGLVAFLIMHLMYAGFFKKYFQAPVGNNKVLTIGVFIIGFLFNFLFYTKLGDMRIPVMVYSMAILTMAYYAINQVLSPMIRYGALFFVASDFILAINKFISPSPILPYAVMITYALAQYFIVMGVSEEADVFEAIRKKKGGKK
jgi:uncharacterized membrane protein YhhN